MSETVNKNIGHATAYGYAKSKGYTGTEAEFAELMASYATTAQTAVDAALRAKASEDAAEASETASAASQTAAATSAGTATTAAQTASQAATTATTKAGEAAQSATTAGTAASTATSKASEAAQSATAAAGSATTAGTAATNAQTAQTAAETAQTAAEAAQAAAEQAAQTLVIDPTLTQPNQAAEAKATGDAISLVKSHLNATIEDNYTRIDATPTQSTADRALSNAGGVVYSQGNVLKEYAVAPGELIALNIEGRASATYPVTYAYYSGSVSANTLIGNAYTNTVLDDVKVVPDGAVYLAISQVSGNTTNFVKKLASKISTVDGEVLDVNNKVEEIDDYIFSESAVQISSITGINAKPGWNAATGSASIPLSTNANVDTYWFVTNEDTDIWFDEATAAYLAVLVGGTYTGTEQSGNNFYIYCDGGSVRYRNIDHNLPTESNKLHVPANCPIAFTITAGKMDSVYGVGGKKVSDRFKNEILAGVGNAKEKYLRYVSGSGADSSTERVEVYLPAASGYVRYDFLHTVSVSLNANVWRIGYAYHATDSLAEDYALTTVGEWECAVKLDGRSDFSGGYAHGDEIMNGITFIVDGEPVDITTLTEITAFKELSIIEDSTFYDPNDSTTAFASHGSEHLFTDDGMTIKQSVNFSLAETVNTMYMAMLPIAKAVSNVVVPNNNYVPLSTVTARRLYNTDGAVIYKTGGKVKADFSVPRFEYFDPNAFTFLCLDNGTTEYNKCYFCNALGNVSVSAGKLMKSETKYKFAISA